MYADFPVLRRFNKSLDICTVIKWFQKSYDFLIIIMALEFKVTHNTECLAILLKIKIHILRVFYQSINNSLSYYQMILIFKKFIFLFKLMLESFTTQSKNNVSRLRFYTWWWISSAITWSITYTESLKSLRINGITLKTYFCVEEF